MRQTIIRIKQYLQCLARNEIWFCVGLIAVILLGYGVRLSNVVVGKDHGYYYPECTFPLLGQGRWGMALLGLSGVVNRVVPFWTVTLGLLLFLLAIVVWRMLWVRNSNNYLSNGALAAFSYLLISYPLTQESYIYPSGMIVVGLGHLLVSLSLYKTQDITENFRIEEALAAIVMLAFALSVYESFAVVYILGGFSIAAMRLIVAKQSRVSKKESICYFCILGSALATSFCVTIALKSFGLIMEGSGAAKTIEWFNKDCSIVDTGVSLCKQIGYFYFYNLFFNFSILIFVITIVALIYIGVKMPKGYNKNLANAAVLGMIVSNFLLSVLQGIVTPYRAAQSVGLFVGVAWMFIYQMSKHKKAVSLFLVLLVVFQTKDLGMWFYDDIRRYEIDKSDFTHCAQLIERECGRNVAKPVIFLGQATRRESTRVDLISPWLTPLPRKAPISQSNCYSLFALDIKNHKEEYYKIYRYLGFSFKPPTIEEENRAQTYFLTNDMPSFPQDGCIVELEDMVVVNLNKREIHGDDCNDRKSVRQ